MQREVDLMETWRDAFGDPKFFKNIGGKRTPLTPKREKFFQAGGWRLKKRPIRKVGCEKAELENYQPLISARI
jgi:hypothetical protein